MTSRPSTASSTLTPRVPLTPNVVEPPSFHGKKLREPIGGHFTIQKPELPKHQPHFGQTPKDGLRNPVRPATESEEEYHSKRSERKIHSARIKHLQRTAEVPVLIADSVSLAAKYRQENGQGRKNPVIDEVPTVESWPAAVLSKLGDQIQTAVKKIDNVTAEGFAIRSEATLDLVQLLSESMPSFKLAFEAISVEIQRLVTEVSYWRDTSQEATAKATAAVEAATRELKHAENSFTRQLASKQAFVDEAESRIAAAKGDADKHYLDKVAAERKLHSYEKEHHVLQEETKQQKKIILQFATRNKELGDQLPALQEQLQEQLVRAEKASLKSQALAKYSTDLENRLEQEQHVAKLTSERYEDKLKKVNVELDTSQAQHKAVREKLRSTTLELNEKTRQLEELQKQHEEDIRVMTPRPTFQQRDMSLFGSLSSTANRLDAISEKLMTVEEEFRLSLKERNDFAAQLVFMKHIVEPGLGGMLPPKSPFVEMAPASTVESRRMPMYLRASPQQVLKCRSMSSKEAVLRMRGLLDTHVTLSGNGSKPVALHMVLLGQVIDRTTVDAAEKAHHRRDPDAAPWVTAVSEQMYAIAHAVQVWPNHPIVKLFGCILREEVGIWVWNHQNKTISTFMKCLAALGTATVEDYLQKIESMASDQGFSPFAIMALQEWFTRQYDDDVPQQRLKNNAAIQQTFQKPGKDKEKDLHQQQPLDASMSPLARRRSTLSSFDRSASPMRDPLLARSSPLRQSMSGESGIGEAPSPMRRSFFVLPPRGHAASSMLGTSSEHLRLQNHRKKDMTVKLEWDDQRMNPASASLVNELVLVQCFRIVHLHRTLAFNAAMDTFLLNALTPKRGGGCTGEERVTKALAHSALQSIFPTSLDVGSATAFVDAAFDACAQQLRLEKAYENEANMEGIPLDDGFVRKDVGINAAIPALQRVFLPGLTDCFHGPLVPYPYLVPAESVRESGPVPLPQRRPTKQIGRPVALQSTPGKAGTSPLQVSNSSPSKPSSPVESDSTSSRRSSFQLDSNGTPLEMQLRISPPPEAAIKAVPTLSIPDGNNNRSNSTQPNRRNRGKLLAGAPTPSASPGQFSLASGGGAVRPAAPGHRLQLFLRMYRTVPFVPPQSS